MPPARHRPGPPPGEGGDEGEQQARCCERPTDPARGEERRGEEGADSDGCDAQRMLVYWEISARDQDGNHKLVGQQTGSKRPESASLNHAESDREEPEEPHE